MELNGVLAQFMESLLKFNYVGDDYKHIIKDDGKRIDSDTFAIVTVGCLLEINKGINEFKVKCIKPSADLIGIMSNMDEDVINGSAFDAPKLMRQLNGYKYWWEIKHTEFLFAYKNKDRIGGHKSVRSWNVARNDIITVRVDCNQWIVTFYLNDDKIGESLAIEPDLTYYFFMSVQWRYSEYELI